MKNELEKTVVVTGATAGIGYQIALDFAKSGAFVIGIGRNPQRCSEARQKILQTAETSKVFFLTADLSSQKHIHSLANQINLILKENNLSRLDVLVNNAGVYMGKKVLTEDGIETTFAVNHIAPFLLTHLLIPLLQKSPDGRIITISSDSHYNTRFIPERAKNPRFFFGLWAYQVSKLSNVLFSLKFNRIHQGSSLHAFAVDPGLVNTEIGLKETGGLAKLVWRKRKTLGVSPSVPSATVLFLAYDPGVINSPALYWHECKPKQPSRAALEYPMAQRLWVESCKICGLSEGTEGVESR